MNIGFIGANDLTKQYYNFLTKDYNSSNCFFIDHSLINARALIKQYPIKFIETETELLRSVDLLIVCSYYKNNDELILKAVRQGKHIFLANPFVINSKLQKHLLQLSVEAGTVIQNAWSEKYNSAFIASSAMMANSIFLDVARLHQYSPSNSKLSVLNDLIFKDVEWVLSVVKSNVRKVSANALSVVNTEPDFINAKIEFDNGCIVNLTASRVSEINLKKARIYNDKSVLFVDFLEKQIKRSYKKSNLLEFEVVSSELKNDAQNQLDDFFNCIKQSKEPQGSLSDLLTTKEVITLIGDKIKAKTNLFAA